MTDRETKEVNGAINGLKSIIERARRELERGHPGRAMMILEGKEKAHVGDRPVVLLRSAVVAVPLT